MSLLQKFPLDQPAKKIQVHKKSFWRFPADAKVALGTKTDSDDYFEATQFVVETGSEFEIDLKDANLEVRINSEKAIGTGKHYPIENSGKGKYLPKAIKVGKVVLSGVSIAISVVGLAS